MWSTPAHGTCSEWISRKRVRIAEVEPAQPLGDDDRPGAVGREVEVVRIRDRDRPARAPRDRVDGRQRVALVVRHVEPLEIPRRHHVLGLHANRELPDHPPRGRIDHIDRVAPGVGHVDQRARPPRRAGQHVGAVVGVDVDLMRRCRPPAVAPNETPATATAASDATARGRGGAVAGDTRSSRCVSASSSTAVAIAIVITGQSTRDPLGGCLRRSWRPREVTIAATP